MAGKEKGKFLWWLTRSCLDVDGDEPAGSGSWHGLQTREKEDGGFFWCTGGGACLQTKEIGKGRGEESQGKGGKAGGKAEVVAHERW